MEKNEFCTSLVNLRNQAGVSKYRMCKLMNILDTHLNRIERGQNSFAISKAIKYLDILDFKMIVTKGNESYSVTSREKLASIAAMIRQDMDMAYQAMATYIGVSKNMIMDMERNKADTGIDKVLQFFDKAGFELKIVHK